ncbi:hypothetical protein L218DRAFT_91067 [Marasmius fiardii PR-910]|nr:hypothetical protein L218DRAFT_91067 [Marasmius fiardii PR-910]
MNGEMLLSLLSMDPVVASLLDCSSSISTHKAEVPCTVPQPSHAKFASLHWQQLVSNERNSNKTMSLQECPYSKHGPIHYRHEPQICLHIIGRLQVW